MFNCRREGSQRAVELYKSSPVRIELFAQHLSDLLGRVDLDVMEVD